MKRASTHAAMSRRHVGYAKSRITIFENTDKLVPEMKVALEQ